MDDFRRNYPVAAPRPYRRRMGYLRGPRWERGEVEGFGLVKVAVGLPRWTDEALGYPYGGGSSPSSRRATSTTVARTARAMLARRCENHLDVRGIRPVCGHVCQDRRGPVERLPSHHRIVICWMETHITAPRIAWPEPDDAPPQTEMEALALFARLEALVGNSLAKRRRLMTWLRAGLDQVAIFLDCTGQEGLFAIRLAFPVMQRHCRPYNCDGDNSDDENMADLPHYPSTWPACIEQMSAGYATLPRAMI